MGSISLLQCARLRIGGVCAVLLIISAFAALPNGAFAEEPQPPLVGTNSAYVEAVTRDTVLSSDLQHGQQARSRGHHLFGGAVAAWLLDRSADDPGRIGFPDDRQFQVARNLFCFTERREA